MQNPCWITHNHFVWQVDPQCFANKNPVALFFYFVCQTKNTVIKKAWPLGITCRCSKHHLQSIQESMESWKYTSKIWTHPGQTELKSALCMIGNFHLDNKSRHWAWHRTRDQCCLPLLIFLSTSQSSINDAHSLNEHNMNNPPNPRHKTTTTCSSENFGSRLMILPSIL